MKYETDDSELIKPWLGNGTDIYIGGLWVAGTHDTRVADMIVCAVNQMNSDKDYMASRQTKPGHCYESTACLHDLHWRCKLTCKFCGNGCLCECHLVVKANDG